MACFNPIHGWRVPGGQVKFRPGDAPGGDPITIACGQCRGCKLERSRAWAVRCMHEAEMHEESCMVTLTYDDEHLPSDKSVRLSEIQGFMKRLRKAAGEKRIRFFACGEYGDDNERPHYHVLLFGIDFSEDRVLEVEDRGKKYFSSNHLASLWVLGLHDIVDLTFASAAYVARYCLKKVNGKKKEDGHYLRVNEISGEVYELTPEFATMSTKPGLGKEWFDKYHADVYPGDFVVMAGGQSCRPPSYYDRLFDRLDPVEMDQLREDRVAARLPHAWNNTPDRLAVREECAERRAENLIRSL